MTILKTFPIVLIAFYFACNTSDKNQETTNNKTKSITTNTFEYSLYKDKFKFHNLNSFEMDTMYWPKRRSVYKILTEEDYIKIFQHEKDRISFSFNDMFEDLLAFYSIQENSFGLNSITILWQTEDGYCDGIDYLIYNKKGFLIDRITLAQNCGDGGYYEYSYGEFINDSTYIKTHKDNYDLDFDSDSLSVTEKMFIIKPSGEIKEKTLKSYIEKI